MVTGLRSRGGSSMRSPSPESTPEPSEGYVSPQSSPGMAPLGARPAELEGVVVEGGRLSAVGAGISSLTVLRHHLGAERVTALDATANDLVGLSGLDLFPRLESLVLDNNSVTSLDGLPELRDLHTLWLNKNALSDLEKALDSLTAKTPALRFLSLMGNPCCASLLSGAGQEEIDRYRAYVIWRMPSLQLLDAAPVTPAERQLAKSKGQFMKVARPEVVKSTTENQPSHYYAKGGQAAERAGEHSSYFGKQRRFYSGKYSEGNRFIRDDDL
eukprot:Hpha_TRINITY_DN10146_c0_g1::TRINITY_DN10146_c0_g1_i1::g.131593::m.131593